MKYQGTQLAELLAAEYMLGTLAGASRRRFERLLPGRPDWRAAVAGWEARLLPLIDGITPIEPPPRVWERIAARTGIRAQQHSRPPPLRRPLWESLGFCRAFTGLASATAFALVLVVGNLRQTTEVPTVTLAVLADESARPVMVVTAEPKSHTVSVTLLSPPTVAADRDLELWALPDGRPPKSLGVVKSRGATVFRLSDPDAVLVRGSKAMAISLEPRGGSPTGTPTRPVLFQGGVIPKQT